MSVEAARVLPSTCPLDCPDACSLEVTLQGDRVTKIEGSHTNPVTRGFICDKVRHYADHVYGPGRLLQPGVRRGAKGEGVFAPVSWDEALDRVAERMEAVRREWGGEAILPFSYGG
ncbi:MAG TPA: molybdopterin-dependent oxidoreductase, partial [Vicinamibacteria bacterium]|nr:molybdopterin-dependent oxidoreductase [Vicinamibacteria bacterium]